MTSQKWQQMPEWHTMYMYVCVYMYIFVYMYISSYKLKNVNNGAQGMQNKKEI